MMVGQKFNSAPGRPDSALQRDLRAYLQSIAVVGIAFFTEEELAAAVGRNRTCVMRAMNTMQARGDLKMTPTRGTFVRLIEKD